MSTSRDGAVSLAFVLLALTGCNDGPNPLDDPPGGRSRGKSSRFTEQDGAVSLAFLLLAITGCDDDRSFDDPIR